MAKGYIKYKDKVVNAEDCIAGIKQSITLTEMLRDKNKGQRIITETLNYNIQLMYERIEYIREISQ